MQQIVRRDVDNSKLELLPSIDPLLQRIYAGRGISDPAMLDLGLGALPQPNAMLGMQKAVQRLLQALAADQSIIVVGDFDADGATSCALMMLGMTSMGYRSIDYLVPNRFDYGYGLTPEIVDLAAQKKPALIVTVDNGISSIDGVAHAHRQAIDVIITDHHLPGAELPKAHAIVNPNQIGCDFPAKNLAGVGVAFYLLSALRAALREQNWFRQQSLPEPNMAAWLDLVALGTVADVVPLDHVNRILVHQGLLRIRAGQCRPGITALLRIAGKNQRRLVAADLGFAVGPRLNAAGRLDDISVGIQCLLTKHPQKALETANELDELNRDRKAIEQTMQSEAMALLEHWDDIQADELPCVLCLFQPDWHQGVVGLLASRLKDKYHRPVVAFARESQQDIPTDQPPQLKGSCRSIPALHIRDALDAVATQTPGLVNKFGGHAMAAGLSLNEDRLMDFTRALQAQVAQSLSIDDYAHVVATDGSLDAMQLNLATAEQLRDHGPWGQQFPEPLFDGVFDLLQQRVVGEKHLKLALGHAELAGLQLDAIHFNMDQQCWPNLAVCRIHCVYRLDINEYRGLEKVQLLIEYLEPA